MALDLDELRSCQRCALSRTRQRVVVGSGPARPTLLVVGEAPGRAEDEGGEPFIGPSGRLLFALLDEVVGVMRDECFVTNVVKCRPPGNRTPRREEMDACRAWLDAQVAEVAPRVTLAVGLTAAREILGDARTMARLHGRVVERPGGVAVATYHPAAALRTPSVVDVMRADLAVVRRLLEDPS